MSANQGDFCAVLVYVRVDPPGLAPAGSQQSVLVVPPLTDFLPLKIKRHSAQRGRGFTLDGACLAARAYSGGRRRRPQSSALHTNAARPISPSNSCVDQPPLRPRTAESKGGFAQEQFVLHPLQDFSPSELLPGGPASTQAPGALIPAPCRCGKVWLGHQPSGEPGSKLVSQDIVRTPDSSSRHAAVLTYTQLPRPPRQAMGGASLLG